jgi:hypothetical protein
MRKIHILGMTLFAVLAFGVVTAASASAETLQWLLNGLPVTVETPMDLEGEFEMSVLSGGSVLSTILCSGLLEGDLNGALTVILDAVSLNGTVIGQLGDTNATPVGCLVTATSGLGCTLNSLAALTVDNLNLELHEVWTLTLELMTTPPSELFLVDFPTNTGYEVVCESGLGTTEVLCEGLTSAVLENMPTENDVLGVITATAEKTACTLSGTEVDLAGEWLITAVGGGTIAVSDV